MRGPYLLAIALLVGVMASGCATLGQSRTRGASPPPKVAVASEQPASTPGKVRHSPPRKVRLPDDVQRWVALTTELGEQLDAAKRNCRTIATRVEAFTKKHRAELKGTNASLLSWETSVDKATVRAFYQTVWPHLNRRIDAAILCDKDPRARRAFDAFLKVSGLDMR